MGSKVPFGVSIYREFPAVARSLWEGDGAGGSLDGFGKLLATGYDTIEECFNVGLPARLLDALEAAKAAAQAAESKVLLRLHGEELQVSPNGGRGGVRYWLESDWCTIKVRVNAAWGVSIRYSAEALWSYGVEELRARALLWLRDATELPRQGDAIAPAELWQRVTEAHFAVDVHAPSMSEAMGPELWRAVVAPAGVKTFPIGRVDQLTDADLKAAIEEAMATRPRQFFDAVRAGIQPEQLSCFASGGKVQTLTIGYRRALEIQIYDKGREIREASGKEWMLDLWEASGNWQRPADGSRPLDVWRTEVRVRGEWMRDRGVLTWADWEEHAQALLIEALASRRLTLPTSDSNRSRWPAHPLWKLVAHGVGFCDRLVPLGRRFLDTAGQRAAQMVQQTVGCLRAAVVLLDGAWSEERFFDLLYRPAETFGVVGVMRGDRSARRKIDELIERYRFVPRAA